MTMSDNSLIPVWKDGVLVPFDKLEAHRLGLRHKAVSVFLLSEKGILLQQRAAGKYHTPNLWANTCCTHPHWNETAEICAHRRLDEELGISGMELNWREQIEYRADVGGGLIEHEVVEIFIGHTSESLLLNFNRDEVQATRWMSRRALLEEIESHPERYTPWVQIYLRDHADVIFG